jgi:hypothetical protein
VRYDEARDLVAFCGRVLSLVAMSWRRGLILVVLVMWAFTGPIGMAFDGCALTCDEPCGLTTASISLAPTVAFIINFVGTAPETLQGRPLGIASSLEPPPRPSVLSA